MLQTITSYAPSAIRSVKGSWTTIRAQTIATWDHRGTTYWRLVDSPAGSPELTYANLAIRGRLIDRIIEEGRYPKALDLKPDLVSFCAGGNDCLRPKADIDDLADQFERAVIAFREAGIEVLMCNGFDTEIASPLIRA